ncbi:hypothetical protein P4V71_24830 [Bacillus thuringiensis]|uniref:hypothetical protein n=1 Tax=Bacillus thuringiensis TaxID=1428 RepID=UPI0005AEE7CA|nr:hypothetical protein [Bacillus thuringiensis]KIP28081.1 hypothetical protein BG10_3581 [Bacillus thuringiensis serovar morrisoni]KIP28849.1 hypothetical protein BG10_2244 [Bacillus thuringiensis serovar morrisoni]MCT6948507.1 hypothetical protein [Bacillus thuringiensis]MED2066169.1 hypothetical protein [Bacillus thuringiensis]MED2075788.1 hypothetical protein [Bacillus thuringiensis]
MESITNIIANLEKSVNDLQRDNDGLKQTLLHVSTTVEALGEKVSMLEKGLATKADITHVQLINKQSEIIKKINDSKSIPMDCKVGVSLDGRVVAESIVEHTADSIKCGVIKGREINGTK